VNEIQTAILSLLPAKRRTTPSGWIGFNAVCCQHNGDRADTRGRGGVLTNANGGFQYHCFNCNFKAGWTPGKLLSANTKKLFQWIGLGQTEINQLGVIALKLKDDQPVVKKELKFSLEEKSLPDQTLPIEQWLKEGCTDPDLLSVIEYIVNERKMKWEWYNWHWSAAPGYRDRVIIPFYHDGKIVGYTGRKITGGNPKYLTDRQANYVFNLDAQKNDRRYIIATEGQFDAIAIDGVAFMHNDPGEVQCARLVALNKEVIVVPDRDRPGAKILNAAIKNGWSASLPPWEDDIKDVADAVKRYGRLYVLTTILHYKIDGELKLNLLKKKLESLNE
jgi:hypothetical protein